MIVAEKGPGRSRRRSRRRIVAGSAARRRDWVSRWLLGPIEGAATRMLMPGRMTPGLVGLGAIGFWDLRLIAFASHWRGTGMALALFATPIEGVSERLTCCACACRATDSWWGYMLPVVAAGALLALGWR